MHKEATKIRNFSEAYNPYEILIKAEGGKPNLKTAFTSIAKSLATRDLRIFLLFDMDGGNLQGIVDDLNEKLTGIYEGNDVQIVRNGSVGRSGPIRTSMIDIVVNGTVQGEFGIIGFETTLENAAGIASHNGDTQEISDRIQSLSTNPEIVDPISEFINVNTC